MSTKQQHIDQWMHNRQLLPLLPATHHDWIATVAFYTALHAVDAAIAFHGVEDITDHGARKHILIKTNTLKQVCRHFLPLYDISRTVRYMADPTSWIRPDRIDAEILAGHLYPIEQSVCKLIGQQLDLPLIQLQK